MDKILNFQMSLFGTFTNVQPNLELTMKINESLQNDNFVPGTIQVDIFNPIERKMISETRLQMVSVDQMWTVVFLGDRIDVNYSYIDGDVYYDSVELIMEKASNICKKAFAPIAATTGTRLAINGRFLLNEMNESTKQAFIARFLIQPKVYENRLLSEWNIRYNSLTHIATNELSSEECNFIISLGDIVRINSQTGVQSTRTSVGIDINTSPANQENKYTVNDLLYFSKGALVNMNAALNEIEGCNL